MIQPIETQKTMIHVTTCGVQAELTPDENRSLPSRTDGKDEDAGHHGEQIFIRLLANEY